MATEGNWNFSIATLIKEKNNRPDGKMGLSGHCRFYTYVLAKDKLNGHIKNLQELSHQADIEVITLSN